MKKAQFTPPLLDHRSFQRRARAGGEPSGARGRAAGEREEEKEKKKEKGKRKGEGRRKRGEEREKREIARQIPRRRPRPVAHARRSGVAHGTRRNRETGQWLDIGTRFSGDRKIGQGMILNGLSSSIEKKFEKKYFNA